MIRLIKWLLHRLFKPLVHWWRLRGARSRQERIERERRAIEKAEGDELHDLLEVEGNRYADIIRSTLTQLNICYRYNVTERKEVKEKIQEVDFYWPYSGDKEKLLLKINTRRLPRGVTLAHLAAPEVLELLSANCKHKVWFSRNVEAGAWFAVEREEGIAGIPRYLGFDDALASRPATMEDDRLAFPLGVAENRKIVWRSLRKTGNILIAGSPGKGKSNFANALLCALLKSNSGKQLKLMLVDLKGGIELSFYAGLSEYLLTIPAVKAGKKKLAAPVEEHSDEYNPEDDEQVLDASEPVEGEIEEIDFVPDRRAGMVPAFIERREHVPAALSYIIGLLEERNAAIKKAGVKDFTQYNKKMHLSGRYLPAILCVIDEWADVKLTPRVGARAEERLINITNRGRAAGIYVVLCTQSPNKDVLSTRVTNAMNTRMVFRTASQYMSMALLSDYSAASLEPPGRAIFADGSDRMQVQAPHIPNELVEEVVSKAGVAVIDDTKPKPKHDVTDSEIFEWALETQDGTLKIKELCAQYNHRGFSQMKIREWLKQIANNEFEIDGCTYKVHPGSRIPPLPTRLLPVLRDVGPDVDGENADDCPVDTADILLENSDVAMLNVSPLPETPHPNGHESGDDEKSESENAHTEATPNGFETYRMGAGDVARTIAGDGRDHDGHHLVRSESEDEAMGIAV